MAVPPVPTHVKFKSNTIIPAPIVNIDKTYDTTGDGRLIGSTYKISLKGKILAYMGSPDSGGNFVESGWYHNTSSEEPGENIAAEDLLKSILTKQDALRTLFSKDNEGSDLEIKSVDGTDMYKMNPRIIRIIFPEGPWHTICDYTIELECDRILVSAADEDDWTDLDDGITYATEALINSASESFDLEFPEQYSIDSNEAVIPIYRAVHRVSATGKRVFSATETLVDSFEAWQHAKKYCEERLDGIGKNSGDITKSYGTHKEYLLGDQPNNKTTNIDEVEYVGYNLVRTHAIDEAAGTYSITETWTLAPSSETALDNYSVTVSTNADDQRNAVEISGQLTGLEERDGATNRINVTKYTNALTAWGNVEPKILQRSENESGTTLNPKPLSSVLSHNKVEGTIRYTYNYDDRPDQCNQDELFRYITLVDTNPGKVVPEIPILGRQEGPILQDTGTFTARMRRIVAEIGKERVAYSDKVCSDAELNKPSVDLSAYAPQGTKVFLISDVEEWNPITGRYIRTVEWKWEQ